MNYVNSPYNPVHIKYKDNLVIIIVNSYNHGDAEVVYLLIEEIFNQYSAIEASIIDISKVNFQNTVIHDKDYESIGKIFNHFSKLGRKHSVLVTGDCTQQYEPIVSIAEQNGLELFSFANTMNDALNLTSSLGKQNGTYSEILLQHP